MSAFDEDFEIDDITGVSGVFSDAFYSNCIKVSPEILNQTYRGRQFVKFLGEIYKRHKTDYGKKSPLDIAVRFVEHKDVGSILVIEMGNAKYGLCPSMENEECVREEPHTV